MAWPTPELPTVPVPPCVRTAERCPGCNFADYCGYLALGESNKQGLEDLRDDVIADFWLPQGAKRRLRDERELATNFVSGQIGGVVIDIRGLHAVNDAHGYARGDELLQQAGDRLHKIPRNVQAERNPDQKERRRPHTIYPVLCVRGTQADELIVFFKGLSATQTKDAASRIASRFSAERAVQDARRGELPIIASVAYRHSSQLETLPAADTAETDAEKAIRIFGDMSRELHKYHDGQKQLQYTELWGQVCGRVLLEGLGERTLPAMPTDHRLIINTWWDTFCPNFMQNPDTFFRRAS